MFLTALRTYATTPDPSTIKPSIRLLHTDKTITIFDLYPKSTFHFLLLPRLIPPLTSKNSSNLKSLLQWNKEKALEYILLMKSEAEAVKTMIEDEMVKKYGYKWPIWMGFHSVPSMEHVHLHILSGDLVSPSLKNKKHYNSFHPSLGFFLHLEDVVSWFDLPQEAFDDKIALPSKDYEPLLKQDLSCFKCGEEFKTIPKLKDHLQNEWENEGKKIKAREERKRKRDEEPAGGEAQDSAVEKQRRKTQNDGKETDQ